MIRERLHSFLGLLTDPRIITLAVASFIALLAVILLGTALLLLIVSFMLVFALESYISSLSRLGLPIKLARKIVFAIFCIIYFLSIIGPIQLAIEQSLQIAVHLPQMTSELSTSLENWTPPAFIQKYQPYVSKIVDANPKFIPAFAEQLSSSTESFIQTVFGAFSSITGVIVYLILLPILVFFLLQDKKRLSEGASRLLPGNFQLVGRIWKEMEERMASYVKSKLWEIIIVGVTTWGVMTLLKFEYATLLGVFTGLSVLVPYVGAFVVAIPALLLGLVQWGFSLELLYLVIAYTMIQFLDGNVLAPFMFSDSVKIPPTAILIGVIIFGRLWGFWGAVFAIPLIALLKSLAHTWLEFRQSANEKTEG